MTVFPDFVLFFFSFFSYDFVFGRRKQRNENECTSTKNEKKWKNGNRWEDLCKMSNARRYMSALRETVKNETGERFRSRHKLFALHSTHRFRKRFSDLWVTVSVQLFCSFLSFRSLFSRVRFISSRRRIQPGSIHRYIPNDVEFFFIFFIFGWWKMVNCAHLIFLNDFHDSIQYRITTIRFSRPRVRSLFTMNHAIRTCAVE